MAEVACHHNWVDLALVLGSQVKKVRVSVLLLLRRRVGIHYSTSTHQVLVLSLADLNRARLLDDA